MQVEVPEGGLGIAVGEEQQRAAVGRPHGLVGVAVAVPGPLDGIVDDVVQADGVVVAQDPGEGDGLSVGRPRRRPGEDRGLAADGAHIAAVDVEDGDGRVLAVGVAAEGDAAAVGSPVWRAVVEVVVGEHTDGGTAGTRFGDHDSRLVAAVVVGREGDPGAIGRDGEVG